MKFETLAIHAGQEPDPTTGAVMTPIYQTSTYAQDGVGGLRNGYEYSRTGNPTRTALEECIAALEAGQHGLAFSSGMAATDTILRTLSPGDHVVCGNDVYGGTFRLFDKEYRRFGLEFSYINSADPQAVAEGLQDNTRLVWVETPSNPLLNITDLSAVAEIVKNHQNRPRFVVDNTFATPYLQQPLTHGVDVVMHSTTKYMGGHSDSVGGAIVTNDQEFRDRLAFLQNAAGAVPGPMDCFLILRGLKTLAVRMDRHSQSAGVVVDFLKKHTNVERVIYPFDETHPGAQAARSQMKLGGGMISFIIKGGLGAAQEMVAETKVFTLAESLGGVESLIEVPAAMTHLSVSESALAVSPSLVRLSVGLENIDDLLADLEQALA